MKKRIVFGIIAALALLFVLPGCSDNNYSVALNKIAGPANLKATAYEGMNMLTWNPAIDAESYDIYRTDPVTKNQYRIGTAVPNTWYKDFVGYGNELVDAQKYEYMVVAKSKSAASGLNASAKTSVTAIIPEKLTVVPITEADITHKLIASDAGNPTYTNRLVITVANMKPNYDYDVTYVYGKNTINRRLDNMSQAGDSFESKTGKMTVIFPVIGGENTINVTATFGNNYGRDYYNESVTTVSKAFPATYKPELDVAGITLSVDRMIAEGGNRVYWGNVPEATSYEVYKVEASNLNLDNDVTITGDWTKLTGAQSFNAIQNRWTLVDTPITTGEGTFIYVLFAINSDATSRPIFGGITEDDYFGGTFKTDLNFSVTTTGIDEVTITWADMAAALGLDDDYVTYTLSVAEVEPIEGDTPSATNYIPGKYTDITPKKADWYNFVYDDLDGETGYVFSLSTTVDGVTTTTEEMSYNFIYNP